MRRLLFLILFISQFAFSQDWYLQDSTPLNADEFVGVDSYNYTYWVKERVLYKQLEGESFSFSDHQLGAIRFVDITNPLTVLVFYYDAQTVVVLDNKLNEIERVVFSRMPEYMEVATIGNAGNRRLWIGNTSTQRLELLDYRNKSQEAISQTFSGEILEQVSNYNYCYIQTTNSIYLYNSYGSVLQKISSKEYNRIYPANKGVVIYNGKDLYYWYKDIEKPERLLLELGENQVKNIFFTRQQLYVFDGKLLHVYIAEN